MEEKTIINKVKQVLDDGLNVLIVGNKGTGKTFLLILLNKNIENSLYMYIPRFYKSYIENLLNLKFKNYNDMYFYILFKSNKVWIIDNYEYSRNIDRLLIKDLSKYQKVIIAVENLEKFELLDKHFYIIDLNKIKFKTIKERLKSIVKDDKKLDFLYRISDNKPLLLFKFARILKRKKKIPKEYIKNRIPIKFKLKKIIPYAYLLLVLRYIFKPFYVFISILAYIIIFLYKLIKR